MYRIFLFQKVLILWKDDYGSFDAYLIMKSSFHSYSVVRFNFVEILFLLRDYIHSFIFCLLHIYSVNIEEAITNEEDVFTIVSIFPLKI